MGIYRPSAKVVIDYLLVKAALPKLSKKNNLYLAIQETKTIHLIATLRSKSEYVYDAGKVKNDR